MDPELRRTLIRSAKVNAPLLIILASAAFLLALRAQNFEDLVFTMLMMYVAAGFLFGNLIIGIMQLARRRQATPHVMVGFACAIAAGVLLGIGLAIIRLNQ